MENIIYINYIRMNLLRNWAQFTNLISVYYYCQLNGDSLLAAMLIIESVHRCKFMYKKNIWIIKNETGYD